MCCVPGLSFGINVYLGEPASTNPAGAPGDDLGAADGVGSDVWIGDWDWLTPAADPRGLGGPGGRGPEDAAERVYQPGEVLALNLSRQGLRAARGLGFTVSRHSLETTRLTLARLRAPPGLTAAEGLTALRQRDPQGYYDLNPVYRLASAAAAECRDVRCYPQTLVGWAESCGVSTRIGLLDSAVDRRHPALAGNKVRAFRIGPGAPSPREREHGTAVAALLVGARSSDFPGLLPQSELVAADVFMEDGNGNIYTDAARMAAGLDWLAGQDPAAINISASGADSGVLHTVIRRVTRSGIPVVAAVGNDGPDAPPAYPAAYDEVLAVTAVDSKLQAYARANRGRHVALAAPGVDVWTPGAGGSGVLREGTSFAAPFVTAAIARLKVVTPRSDPAELSRSLRKTARQLGPPGDDPIFGSGLLQAGRCPTR